MEKEMFMRYPMITLYYSEDYRSGQYTYGFRTVVLYNCCLFNMDTRIDRYAVLGYIIKAAYQMLKIRRMIKVI